MFGRTLAHIYTDVVTHSCASVHIPSKGMTPGLVLERQPLGGPKLPWGSTLNNYFRAEGDLGLYWTVEMDLALVLVLVLMLVLMLVLVSVWVLK